MSPTGTVVEPAAVSVPTLAQVAELAGVSPATASRVINGSARVSHHARAQVEDAIRRLGYVRHRPSSRPAGRSTGSIAAVVCEDSTRVFADPFFARVLHGARRALGKSSQLVILMAGGGQQAVAGYLRGGHAAGVLLVSTRGDHPLLHAAAGVPVVLAGRPQADSWIPHVDIDDRGGARAAVEHLLNSGRRAIGTIAGPPDTILGADRLAGYRDAVTDAGMLSSGLVAYGDLRQASGEHAMNRLLDRWPTIDAVLVASDLMAAGAMRALHRAKRRVPEDVAVIGFGDSAIAQHLRPRLTTVHQPLEEMGARATHELLSRIAGKPVTGQSIVLSTKLIVRESA